jgi:hypothetical protein
MVQRDMFDLFVWYAGENPSELSGFQLCYGKNDTGGIHTDRALTWKRTGGFSHDAIDTGRYSPTEHRSPILVADGVFPKERIAAEFGARSAGIGKDIRDFVLTKLREY